MKKKLLGLFALASMAMGALAQAEGTPYYLPKTEMHFRVLVEKNTYTPGEFAIYADRFLKKTVKDDAEVSYRLVGIGMYCTAVPDSTKEYFLPIDKKHTILNVERDENGVLMAVNAKGKQAVIPQEFKAAPQPEVANPHDFMSEDILTAGSAAKMAELTAREIYDIRASRNELSRGEADYMPKDGAQLKLMFANLDRQEAILLQTFEGMTKKDTIEYDIRYVPEKESKSKALLFRLSKHLGVVDNDDYAGSPYYITVEDLNTIPELKLDVTAGKKGKEEVGIPVNLPGKVKATVYDNNTAVKTFECYLAQYGKLEKLSPDLFGKKILTKLQLNPINGNVENIDTEPLE